MFVKQRKQFSMLFIFTFVFSIGGLVFAKPKSDLVKQEPGFYYGFGQGSTKEEAEFAAKKDLIENSLTSEGCVITKVKLKHSVIGVRSVIENGSELNDVIMMGSDFYETEDTKKKNEEIGKPNIGIGKNCKIASTIIDKNAAIGDNCQINISGKKYEDGDHGLFYATDGIIVIRKGTVIPAGTII